MNCLFNVGDMFLNDQLSTTDIDSFQLRAEGLRLLSSVVHYKNSEAQ